MSKKSMKIIFVPGWTYSEAKALPFCQALRNLGYDTVLLKVPGLTGAKLAQPWTLTDYADWLAQTIEKTVSANEDYVLMAHSNGGRIVLKFLSTKIELAQRATQLIFIDSAGLIDRRWYKVLKRDFLGLAAKVLKPLTQQDKLRRCLYKIIRERDYYEASPVMRQTMANLLTEDLRAVLPKITQPTLLIWGSEDQMTPLILAEEMQQKIPGATLKIIDGARHVPQFTHLSKTLSLVMNFLENTHD